MTPKGDRRAGEAISCNHTVAPNSENSASSSLETPNEGAVEPSQGLIIYSWYQEYVALTERFPWRLAAYIAWAASPVIGRLPATQLELAQALGLKTDRTIRQWKEKNPTIDEEIEKLQAAPLWRHRRDLYDALVRTAVTGDVPALKLALEMTGDYVPRMKQTVDNTIKPGNYTADDLATAQKELQEWESQRQGDKVAG
ncbi:MAG: hypothetical protein DYG89_04205 [Caldilinea sp. CFX5]|nr:hypothetical protein [Caldilinea sp. CFX5]